METLSLTISPRSTQPGKSRSSPPMGRLLSDNAKRHRLCLRYPHRTTHNHLPGHHSRSLMMELVKQLPSCAEVTTGHRSNSLSQCSLTLNARRSSGEMKK